jgi:hypothetical protein
MRTRRRGSDKLPEDGLFERCSFWEHEDGTAVRGGYAVRWLVLLMAVALPAQEAGRLVPKKERFRFALIGDQQYTATQEKLFENVIDSMNGERLAFVVHDGDIKNGQSACDDATFGRRLQTFSRSLHPFILTPGDNDWTDCGRPSAGGMDPLERLAKVREMFYPAPGRTLGKRRMATVSQSQTPGFEAYVENLMWAKGMALFATLHIVGTNNNAARPAEFGPRNRANIAWLRRAFTTARERGFRGVMFLMQANPKFDVKQRQPGDGFADFLSALEEETRQYSGQVVLVHGDSHYFRIDKPLVPKGSPEGSRLENFTRVETFGPPDVHWIRGTSDPADPMVFQFEQRIVPANVRKR